MTKLSHIRMGFSLKQTNSLRMGITETVLFCSRQIFWFFYWFKLRAINWSIYKLQETFAFPQIQMLLANDCSSNVVIILWKSQKWNYENCWFFKAKLISSCRFKIADIFWLNWTFACSLTTNDANSINCATWKIFAIKSRFRLSHKLLPSCCPLISVV